MSQTVQPLQRHEFDARRLVADHPPIWYHPNKQLVYEIACPVDSEHGGSIGYSRWPTMELPEAVDVASAVEKVAERTGFFDYVPASETKSVEWHLNFADAHLFVAYSGALLAQDELQVLEHPALGSVREALQDSGDWPLTVEDGKPTPVLLTGVERRCALATDRNKAAGRPDGLYGNHFARASGAAVRKAARRLEPPTISNIVAIEAPAGGAGPYTSATIRYILVTAYSGFRAAVLESERLGGASAAVVVHTGFWGCGAYGGNRVLMAALQIVASGLAGLDRLVFHTGESEGAGQLRQGMALCREELGAAQPVPVDCVVSTLTSLEYEWGASNGT